MPIFNLTHIYLVERWVGDDVPDFTDFRRGEWDAVCPFATPEIAMQYVEDQHKWQEIEAFEWKFDSSHPDLPFWYTSWLYKGGWHAARVTQMKINYP